MNMQMWIRHICLSLVVALLCAADVAAAARCPDVLAEARRLVLVTAPDMNQERVTVRLYVRDRPAAAWRALSGPLSAVIGRRGMGWGYTFRNQAVGAEPVKREGDKRTPSGFFRIGPSFGFEPSGRAGHVILKMDETICVDDVRSNTYNSIRPRSEIGPAVRGENMRKYTIYRHGLFVDYPSNRKAKAGSCIFMHLMTKSGRGTLGCVAMPEMTLLGVQHFSEPGAVLGVLPETALSRFAGCLPAF
jgi:D-alanyl-D-alanine dipeptidase